MNHILPVLLGSDANAYGMARSFYMEYGVRSVCVCRRILSAVQHSKLFEEYIVEPRLEEDEAFVCTLQGLAAKYPGLKRILVSCSDGYSVLISRNKEQLRDLFEFSCPDIQTLLRLNIKESFYQSCEEFGLSYPKTTSCTKDNWENIEIPFSFPCIIKASNSMEYRNCVFPGKKKVFLAHDGSEMNRIISTIYSSSYQDSLILQEYIPGEDTCCRVLNCYSGLDGKVRLLALGKPLLEDQTPEGRGNYLSILSVRDDALLIKVKAFLEAAGWQGFSNFDLKWDERTGEYRFFEMNPRQGRSSFYVTASGYNLAKWLTEDVVEHKELSCTIAEKEFLWLLAPCGLLKKYVKDRDILRKAKKLKREGKSAKQLLWSKDINFRRFLWYLVDQLTFYILAARYFEKRGAGD